jgi:two-component system, NarL family, invasion response regulator UvrY
MKILIIDDHPVVIKGLSAIILEKRKDAVCLEASTGKQALDMLKKDSFDVVLLDISLPDYNGLQILEKIKLFYPEIKVLMISIMDEPVYARKCFESGANGFIKKEAACQDLLLAINNVLSGKLFFSDIVLQSYLNKTSTTSKDLLDKLSKQEFLVLSYLGQGMTNKEIADIMCVSDKTVSSYKTRLLAKLNLERNVDIYKFCVENDILT